MAKVDIRVKRTYKQLYNAFVQLLSEKNFEDITIIEICNKAEIHRATFYKHFLDKHDFLNTCLKMKINELNFTINENKFTPSSMKNSCMMMFSKLLDFVEENRDLLIKIKQNEYQSSFNAILNDCITTFLIQRFESMYNISPKLGDNIYLLSNFYSGAIVGLIKWWIDADTNLKRDDLIQFAEIKVNDLINHFKSLL